MKKGTNTGISPVTFLAPQKRSVGGERGSEFSLIREAKEESSFAYIKHP